MGIWVSDLLSYQGRQVWKGVFVGFKKGVKVCKIWDPMDKKFILSKDVTFDETLMMKPMNSQQVE